MTLPGLSLTLALAGILAPTLTDAGGQASKITALETITANAHVAGSAGAVATRVTMQIDRYIRRRSATPSRTHSSTGATRDSSLRFEKRRSWGPSPSQARRSTSVGPGNSPSPPAARLCSLPTSRVHFVGGGSTKAKPREGYEVAVLQFRLDDSGLGFEGTMAAAARVKPGGPSGVQIDDYAEKPIQLQTINRAIK